MKSSRVAPSLALPDGDFSFVVCGAAAGSVPNQKLSAAKLAMRRKRDKQFARSRLKSIIFKSNALLALAWLLETDCQPSHPSGAVRTSCLLTNELLLLIAVLILLLALLRFHRYVRAR